MQCSTHGCAGRKAIIDDDHDPVTQIKGRAIRAIGSFPPFTFALLQARYLLNRRVWDTTLADNVIDHAHASRSNCPHRQCFVAWYTTFAHNQHIQRDMQRMSDLSVNWDAAARQRKHDAIRAVGIGS
jgi:hypothetical protein